jgi:altronate dehydratase
MKAAKMGSSNNGYKNAILLNNKDDVACVLESIFCGDSLNLKDSAGKIVDRVVAKEDIPRFHKIALRDLKKGIYVHKYGEVIGKTTADIKRGEYVHVHNIASVKVGNSI